MTGLHKHERGEGKIGCMISLLVLVIVGALAAKIVPVLYSNNALTNAAGDLCSRAGILPAGALEAQLRAKAIELEIPEALPKGHMTITVVGDHNAGTCIMKLHFTRKIDLYGLYTLPIDMDKTISQPYMDVR